MKEYNILFITHSRIMGGANRSMLQLIKELEYQYNIKPLILIPNHIKKDWDIEDECKKYNIDYITNRFYWFKSSSKSFINYLKFFLNFLFLFQILYKIRNKKIDLIHSNGSVIDIGAYLSIIINKKHIWHLREFGDLDFKLHPLLGKKYESIIYNTANAFIAISKKIQEHFALKINKNKIHLIYNGISPEVYNITANHNNTTINICISGLISKAKNQLEAVKAVELIVKKYNFQQLHLFIIGNNKNDYGKELLDYINKHQLNEFITFTGMIQNVPEYLSRMDIGLMLSQNEAFGRVTIEYMLQELAVIASNTGANEEIITNNLDGLIYELNNIEMLASSILKLCNNKEFLLQIASNGKQTALNKFTSHQNTNSIYKLYQNILQNNL